MRQQIDSHNVAWFQNTRAWPHIWENTAIARRDYDETDVLDSFMENRTSDEVGNFHFSHAGPGMVHHRIMRFVGCTANFDKFLDLGAGFNASHFEE